MPVLLQDIPEGTEPSPLHTRGLRKPTGNTEGHHLRESPMILATKHKANRLCEYDIIIWETYIQSWPRHTHYHLPVQRSSIIDRAQKITYHNDNLPNRFYSLCPYHRTTPSISTRQISSSWNPSPHDSSTLQSHFRKNEAL
jgi:hypothetical protein